MEVFENQNFSKSWKSHITVVVNIIGKNDSDSAPKKQHLKKYPAPQSTQIPLENCKFSAQSSRVVSKNYILPHIFWKAIKPLSMKIL